MVFLLIDADLGPLFNTVVLFERQTEEDQYILNLFNRLEGDTSNNDCSIEVKDLALNDTKDAVLQESAYYYPVDMCFLSGFNTNTSHNL